LRRGERWFLILLLICAGVFGGVFVYRSALTADRRLGDLPIYLRAAWAVRTGGDLYKVTDHNGWHYAYPPLFAILLTPLADAPPGADRTGLFPTWVSSSIYYVLNLVLLALAVHWLAWALEKTSPHFAVREAAAGSRRWWLLRLVPLAICLPPLALTLMRGQANLFVLLMLCGMIACFLRGRRFSAGLCIAGAACLKVFPAYLLLIPLLRRDARCLAGSAVGLVLSLAVIPAAAMGPGAAFESYRSLANQVLAPGLGRSDNATMARELTHITATASQSFLAAIHNTLYLDPATRPVQAEPWERLIHWALAATFLLATLLACRGRKDHSPLGTVLLVGALSVVMILTSPVCHIHYFVLALPLVMGLLAWSWEQRTDGAPSAVLFGLDWRTTPVLAVFLAAQIAPHLAPALQAPRDVGVAMYGALALWLAGCLALRRLEGSAAAASALRRPARAA
jgi:hypothetical protein